MEKDDTYVPKTRSELSLPPKDTPFDYEDLLGDAPLYNLLELVARQLLGFPLYLCKHIPYPIQPKSTRLNLGDSFPRHWAMATLAENQNPPKFVTDLSFSLTLRPHLAHQTPHNT